MMTRDEIARTIVSNSAAAAALALTIIMGAAFLGNLLGGTFSFWWLRMTILLVLAACWIVLRSQRTLSLTVKESAASRKDDMTSGHGSFSGTPLYMSPEQASAYEGVDGRADIYSLGAVAYYLLTGRPPFSGMNVVQLLTAHARGEVTAPSSVNAAVPKDVERVILRYLEKKQADYRRLRGEPRD